MANARFMVQTLKRPTRVSTLPIFNLCQPESAEPRIVDTTAISTGGNGIKDQTKIGGRERIRTSGRVTPTSDFESDAFNHSATLPASGGNSYCNFIEAANLFPEFSLANAHERFYRAVSRRHGTK